MGVDSAPLVATDCTFSWLLGPMNNCHTARGIQEEYLEFQTASSTVKTPTIKMVGPTHALKTKCTKYWCQITNISNAILNSKDKLLFRQTDRFIYRLRVKVVKVC